jgi:hypothetical protein
LAGFGTKAGAVYTPTSLIVPTVALPPVTLFTSQVTPVLLVPVTVALKDCVLPLANETEVGDIVIPTCVIVTVAEAVFTVSA